MADVFISYHEDSAGTLARQIADTLEQAGISCWYAKRDMPFGGDFAEVIPGQIDNCKVFLLLLNENAPHSRHIRSEMGLAFGRYNEDEDIKILPLKLGKFERKPWIRYFLNQVQIIPFSAQPDAQQLHQLAAQIAKLLDREPQPATISKNPFTDSDSFLEDVSSGKMESVKDMELFLEPVSEIIDSGECGAYGNNVTYRLYENGQLVISGFGNMQDYPGDENAPWYPHRNKISDVWIQKGVKSIGDGAFYHCTHLPSISIPDSVTSINFCAFQDCINLRNVSIPDSVTFIDIWAFAHCENLTSVSIPAETKIHSFAFDEHTTVTRRPKKP